MKESSRGPPGIFTAFPSPFFLFALPRLGPEVLDVATLSRTKNQKITADGGSLGSRVDEERSQLRESM